MNKYEKGQIYKIVSPDFSKCYIGSTTEGLSRRLARHKASYHHIRNNNKRKNCSSFMLFDEYGIDNCKIYWVEDYPCSSKKELEAREGHHIQTTDCVNKVVAGRTRNEWNVEYREKNKDKLDEYYKQWKENNQEHLKEYRAKYYQDNKEHYQQKGKEWREKNKEHKEEQDKQYRENNKDRLKEYFKEYDQTHQETRKAYKQQKYSCECGAILCRGSKSHHIKSQKHQDWLKQQEQQEQQLEE